MASDDPITGAPTRAPSIQRRSLLAALALAPVATNALPSVTPARSAWANACVKEAQTKATCEAFHLNTIVPAAKRHQAVRDTMPPILNEEHRARLDVLGYLPLERQFADMFEAHYDAMETVLTMPRRIWPRLLTSSS